MKEKAPGLKRFQYLKQLYKEDMLKLTELEYIYKATCEDLQRLRLSERYLLDESFDGGRNDLNRTGSVSGFGAQSPVAGRERRYSFNDGLTDNESVSVISHNSAMPCVHVENYFLKSQSSFHY